MSVSQQFLMHVPTLFPEVILWSLVIVTIPG